MNLKEEKDFELYMKMYYKVMNDKFPWMSPDMTEECLSFILVRNQKIYKNYDKTKSSFTNFLYHCIKCQIFEWYKRRYKKDKLVLYGPDEEDYVQLFEEDYKYKKEMKRNKILEEKKYEYLILKKKLWRVLTNTEKEMYVIYENNIETKGITNTNYTCIMNGKYKKLDNAMQRIKAKAKKIQNDFYKTNKLSKFSIKENAQ